MSHQVTSLALVFRLPLANQDVSDKLAPNNVIFNTQIDYNRRIRASKMDLCLVGSPTWAVRMLMRRNKTSEYIVERPLSPGIHVCFELRMGASTYKLHSRFKSFFVHELWLTFIYIVFRLFSVDPGLTCTFSTLSKRAWVSDTDKLGGHEERFDNPNSLKFSPSAFLAIN